MVLMTLTATSSPNLLINSPLRVSSSVRFSNNSLAYAFTTPDQYEAMVHHAGWAPMMDKAITLLSQEESQLDNTLQLLECGPANGTSTDRLSRLSNTHITALEIDPHYHAALKKRYTHAHNITTQLGDAITYRPQSDRRYDACAWFFSLTHLTKTQRTEFFQHAKNDLLTSKGLLLIGDEFLDYNPKNPLGRFLGHLRHHGNVIWQALLERQWLTAFLEAEAMVSGMRGVADFKCQLPELQQELQEAGFELTEPPIQTFPTHKDKGLFRKRSGGVYLFAARVKE